MSVKLPGEIITKVTLNDATFKNTGAHFEPTYINYFFGNNGTGKSTIAKSIKDGTGVSYASGKAPEDCLVLLYDQDFIDANLRNFNKLPGVFTINAQNVEIQEQIDAKVGEQSEARTLSSSASSEKEKKITEKGELETQLYKDCWDKTADLREEFEQTQEGMRGSKQKFTKELQKHESVQHDLDELRRTYDAAYSESAKRYERFATVPDVHILDTLEGSELLGESIANSSDTDFAKFLKRVGSSKWVRQGHAEFHEAAGDQCPYCSQPLPGNFEETLKASFDTQYEEDLQNLEAFLDDYRSTADTLCTSLERIPEDLYPALDVKPYKDKLNALKGVITSNKAKIKEKIDKPSDTVSLEETTPILEEISDIIDGFNTLIDDNNNIVDAGPKKKTECRNAVFEHMAFTASDILSAYDRNSEKLESEIKAQDDIIEAQKSIIETLSNEIKALNSQTVETETAMNTINAMLKDAGFQGFALRPHMEESVRPDGTIEMITPTPVIHYDVIRTETGKIAEHLSEGEKNFIAFLYFLQLVYGSEKADGDTREKIVVIDDPVSSMDSGSLFIVGAQVRKMVEICRNNVYSDDPVVPGNFIKQIFILTHNAYFHKEVTYPYADRYEFVSFYHVKKHDNKSSVTLRHRPDPDSPSDYINVNPVKDSYAALWDEYKEARSGIPLINVIRRILEYYFLQLCGFTGSHLQTVILEENKHKFIYDDDGNEDYTKYDMASSMLSYIAVYSSGINDGMHYTNDFSDIDLCRKTFEMIFREMGQGQHFDMMMARK